VKGRKKLLAAVVPDDFFSALLDQRVFPETLLPIPGLWPGAVGLPSTVAIFIVAVRVAA
jgi:hypothetical protein